MSLTSPPPAPPTAPPSSPSPPPPPLISRPRGPQRDNRIWWLVGGAAVIVGLIVAGGSLFSQVSREGTSFKYGWPFVVAGLAFGLAAGAILVFSARQAGFRSTTTEMAAIVVLAAALGALLGLALAPPKVDPEETSPLPTEEQQRRKEEYGDLPDSTKAGPIDRDGDGQPDLDENGDPIVGLDTDGDGVYDTILVPCPPDSPTPRMPEGDDGGITISYRRAAAPRTVIPPDQQIIDQECDGTIDDIIEWDDGQLLTPPDGEAFDPDQEYPDQDYSETPSTISPRERQQRADDLSAPSLGGVFRAVLIGVAVLLLVGVIGFLLSRMKRTPKSEVDEDSDDDGLPLPPPSAPVNNENFKRSLEDLINDPDPRNGILAAYGHLLVGFDEIGLGRLPHEGPQEHLDRALSTSSADPNAAKELTAWFAVARFSDHPITEDDRRRAVAALRRVTSTIDSRMPTAANAPA